MLTGAMNFDELDKPGVYAIFGENQPHQEFTDEYVLVRHDGTKWHAVGPRYGGPSVRNPWTFTDYVYKRIEKRFMEFGVKPVAGYIRDGKLWWRRTNECPTPDLSQAAAYWEDNLPDCFYNLNVQFVPQEKAYEANAKADRVKDRPAVQTKGEEQCAPRPREHAGLGHSPRPQAARKKVSRVLLLPR